MALRNFAGKTPKVATSAFVDETALVLGEAVLGDDVSIWPMVVLRADLNYIHIGARSNIQDGSILHNAPDYEYCPGGLPVIVGEDVTVGHNVILHACTIGNRCLIGMGSTILDGAVIGDDVIIGANSLVTQNKKLEGGYLYFGNPLKQARPLKPEELVFLKNSAKLYVELKNKHMK